MDYRENFDASRLGGSFFSQSTVNREILGSAAPALSRMSLSPSFQGLSFHQRCAMGGDVVAFELCLIGIQGWRSGEKSEQSKNENLNFLALWLLGA